MDFQINYNKAEAKIVVIGEFEDSKNSLELVDVLSLLHNNSINITFLGANIIPRIVLEKLFIMQEQGKSKVFVLKRYLYSYLQNIGLKCKYIEKNYSITNINNSSSNENGAFSQEEVNNLLKDINTIYGYDYTEYQIDSIMRRLKITMIKEGISNFKLFREQVLSNEKIFYSLFLDLSINTTEFFRDPLVFASIREKIIPYLNSYNHIKIWCAGCSIGKEVYSLAIMLKEAGILDKTQIYATDINPYVIEEAKNGIYSKSTLDIDINNYRNSRGEKSFIQYFDINENYIKVKQELMKNILFFQHSMLSTGTLNEFNLILCRNVFIYFNDNLQEKMLKNFHNSLNTNGFLVLGKSESIQRNNGELYFRKYDEMLKIYKKK